MLRATKQWDIRCPQALSNLFPVRAGYYYKIDRTQAQQVCDTLSKAYGINPALVKVRTTTPDGSNRGVCWYLANGRSEIEVHGRGHIKSTFHEWYHGTRSCYSSQGLQQR